MRNSRGSSRRGRIAAWVVVAAVAVTAFASLGGVGLAQNAIGLHQYQYGKKVTVCHKGKQSIRISLRGWLAHKRHGDTVGMCKTWKKHGKHWKKKQHGRHWKKQQGEHGKQGHATRSQKGKGSGSNDAKTSESGNVFKVVTSSSGSDTGKGNRGERGGKGEGRGHGKGGKGN